jgi:subtilisin family serine protease
MTPLDIVKLTPVMALTRGSPALMLGLIDGPVMITHPGLAGAQIHEVPGRLRGTCAQASSVACRHGTFMAGILCAQRTSPAAAICPSCTLLVRPIFAETTAESDTMPSAAPEELAVVVLGCIQAGARVLNLSLALAQSSSQGERALTEALNHATQRGVLVVAAAGNQGTLGRSIITRHPWVIPVVACDLRGRPMPYTNLGRSIGKRGLSAPGDRITSLGTQGPPLTLDGTSVAAPFVTGAIALLWSAVPAATAADVHRAITHPATPRWTTLVPPLLDAWGAYMVLCL